VHASSVTDNELNVLIERYGLLRNTVRDVRDTQELPRVEYGDKGHLYMFLRVPRSTRRGDIVANPLLVVVRDKIFLTIGSNDIFQPDSIISEGRANTATTPLYLALLTFAAVITEYESHIHQITRIVRDVSHRLRTHDVTNSDFVRFVTIEDNLNECGTNLDGMLALARHLRENRRQLFTVNDEEMVDDILLHIQQLLVAVSSQRQSITSIRDAYSTIANNALNQRMKTLTVLTILIALPNVFYGMYGMNVSLPFADQPWAYAVVVLFTFVLIIAVYLLARRFRIF
jgi:magnesium transporter